VHRSESSPASPRSVRCRPHDASFQPQCNIRNAGTPHPIGHLHLATLCTDRHVASLRRDIAWTWLNGDQPKQALEASQHSRHSVRDWICRKQWVVATAAADGSLRIHRPKTIRIGKKVTLDELGPNIRPINSMGSFSYQYTDAVAIFTVRIPSASYFAAFHDLLGNHVESILQVGSCKFVYASMRWLFYCIEFTPMLPVYHVCQNSCTMTELGLNWWQPSYIVLFSFFCFYIACGILNSNKLMPLFLHVS
jgi:hypothetical protein